MNIDIKERNLNKNNSTPLYYAKINKSSRMEQLLLSRGADINAKDIIYRITIKHF